MLLGRTMTHHTQLFGDIAIDLQSISGLFVLKIGVHSCIQDI